MREVGGVHHLLTYEVEGCRLDLLDHAPLVTLLPGIRRLVGVDRGHEISYPGVRGRNHGFIGDQTNGLIDDAQPGASALHTLG